MLFLISVKMLQTLEKLGLAVCGSFWLEKHLLDLKEIFLVNFRKNVSKHQKNLVKLHVAHFVEKNTFLNINRFFLSKSAKMIQTP